MEYMKIQNLINTAIEIEDGGHLFGGGGFGIDLKEVQDELDAIKSLLNGVGRSTKKNKTKPSVKCLHCGRSFIKKLPHKCNTGYRKRNHKWQELADD